MALPLLLPGGVRKFEAAGTGGAIAAGSLEVVGVDRHRFTVQYGLCGLYFQKSGIDSADSNTIYFSRLLCNLICDCLFAFLAL